MSPSVPGGPSPDLVRDAGAAAVALPPGTRLGEGLDLGGSSRSQVRRHAVLDGPPGWGGSVVVKRFLTQPPGSRAATGYHRELVGLTYLQGAPRLLARDDASQTLVMQDLGEQLPTLADVLLGADPEAAWRHTVAWAGALGRTVRAEPEVLAPVRRELEKEIAEDRETRRDFPRRGLMRLREVGALRSGAAAATAEILDVVDWLERDTRRHVLGPGDACPDNAVLAPEGVRLVDLEAAGVRHVAYEAAYAAEPFSTCWCVFTPPTGLPDAMLTAFTDAASHRLPGLAADPGWRRQVRGAIAVWVLSATLWLLDGALEDRTVTGGGDPPLGPPFRALLTSRWRWVVRECGSDLPDIAAVCEEALTWAARTWQAGSSTVLPAYPAWRGR